MKPLKHRCEVVRFRKEVQERRGEGKPSFDHLGGEKLWRAKPKSVGGWKRLPRDGRP